MRKVRKDRSAQALVLTALLIALIILSTKVYVLEVNRVQTGEDLLSPEAFTRNVRLGSRSLVIGVLVNASHGGNQTLEPNIERWVSFAKERYYHGECSLSFNLEEEAPYSSGLWISWGEDGFGVSSAAVDFSLTLTGEGVEIDVVYSINVTTSLSVSAVSRWWAGTHMINVTIHLYNEGEPALAKNITVYYETEDGWMDASLLESYQLEDFGNGTYVASFSVGPPRTFNRGIMVGCHDQRDIYVQANTTCTDLEWLG